MTKQQRKDFDRMCKAILKHGVAVDNQNLPDKSRIGPKLGGVTIVIPTFKFLKEVVKFVNKYNKEKICKPTKSKP